MMALGEEVTSPEGAGAGGSASSSLDPAYAQFRDQSRFWIQRVAVPMLMVIGLFGNSITIIIMTRRRMRSTTNMYLAALAFVDMLYLVLTFLLGLSHYPNMAASKYYAYWRLRPFLMMLTDACSNTSVWLTVTFTIERYIAVKYPMKGKVWCTEVRAKMLIVGVFFFGILFASPVPFEWKVIEKVVPVAGGGGAGSTSNTITTLIATSTNQNQINSSSSSNDQLNKSDIAPPMEEDLYSSSSSSDYHDQDGAGALGSESFPNPFQQNPRQAANNQTENNINNNETSYNIILALDYSDFGRNETYKTIYYWSTAVIFYFIPLFSLMLFNGFLIKSVHQSKRERTKMVSASESSGHHSTISSKTDSNIVQLNGDSNSQVGAGGGAASSKSRQIYQQNGRFKSLSFSSWRKRKRASGKNEQQNSSFHCKHPIGSAPLINEIQANEESANNSHLDQQQQQQHHHHHHHHQQQQQANNLPSIEEAMNSQSSGGADLNVAASDATAKTPPATTITLTMGGANVQSNCDSSDKEGEEKKKKKLAGVVSDVSESIHVMNRVGPKSTLGAHGLVSQQGSQEGSKTSESLLSTSPLIRNSSFRRTISSFTSSLGHTPAHAASGATAATAPPAGPHPASSQERRITIMLIAVVILFLICQIPSAAMLLYTSVHDLTPNTNEHALVLAFGNIFNFLMAVNAAGNFILYSFLSKKYRLTFMILFCKCFGAKQKYQEPRRVQSVRFESSNQSLRTNLASANKADKAHKDTTPL